MSLLSANDIGVIGAHVDMPLAGVWIADLVLDQPDGTGFDAGTAVTLKAEDGFELKGTVQPDRTGSFLDSVHVRVVGGKGGMGKTVTARGYVQPGAYVQDVLNGIVGDVGESLASSIDTAFLTTNLTAWSVFSGTAAQALNAFLAFVAPTAVWRFLADGTLWVGVDKFDASQDTFDILGQNPSEGTADLGVTSPSVLPGVSLEGVGKVGHVEHFVDEGGLRSHVFIEMAAEARGPREAIAGIVRQEMSHVDFFGLYECRAVSQSADLSTVDVQPLPPVDKKLPGLQRVEFRTEAGVKIQLTPGAKVLLGWKGGDPRYPYVCTGLGGDTPIKIQLAGTHPAPLWDTFLTDFGSMMASVSVILLSSTATGPLLGAAAPAPPASGFATNADALAGALVKFALPVANPYKSTLVSNG